MPADTKENMAARTRLTFDVSERVRRALNIAAAEQALTLGQILERLAEAGIPEALASADRAIAKNEAHTSKPGRKPKK